MPNTETLFTCAQCGRGNFTKAGLRAHRCKPEVKTGEVVTDETPANTDLGISHSNLFANAKLHAQNFIEHGRRSIIEAVLLGHELNLIKKALGIQRGGDQEAKAENLPLPWRDLVEQQTGLAYETCRVTMNVAEAGKKHIALLACDDVATTPFAELPEKRQAEVVKAIAACADGNTMKELMFAWGVKKPKAIGGGEGRPVGSIDTRTEAQQARDLWWQVIEPIGQVRLIGNHEALLHHLPLTQPDPVPGEPPPVSLALLKSELEGLLDLIKETIKHRRKVDGHINRITAVSAAIDPLDG